MSAKKIDPALGDYEPQERFAEMIDKTVRTVSRWRNQPDGLPYAVFGREIYIPMEAARAWLASKIRRPNPRREGAA